MKEQDFSTAKVGDKVWTIKDGDCSISRIITHRGNDLLRAGRCWYAVHDGTRHQGDKFPSLFWSNPNIIAPEKPKRVVKHEIEMSVYQVTQILENIPVGYRGKQLNNVCITFETLE